MSVLLGIDLGERRIGVACGDTTSGGVQPLLTLRRSTPVQDAAAISRLCAERRADAVVVGLPLHLDGTESEQSRRTREWAAAVRPDLSVPLTFRDERLTSQVGGGPHGPCAARPLGRPALVGRPPRLAGARRPRGRRCDRPG